MTGVKAESPPPDLIREIREEMLRLMTAHAQELAAKCTELCIQQVWTACLACLAAPSELLPPLPPQPPRGTAVPPAASAVTGPLCVGTEPSAAIVPLAGQVVLEPRVGQPASVGLQSASALVAEPSAASAQRAQGAQSTRSAPSAQSSPVALPVVTGSQAAEPAVVGSSCVANVSEPNPAAAPVGQAVLGLQVHTPAAVVPSVAPAPGPTPANAPAAEEPTVAKLSLVAKPADGRPPPAPEPEVSAAPAPLAVQVTPGSQVDTPAAAGPLSVPVPVPSAPIDEPAVAEPSPSGESEPSEAVAPVPAQAMMPGLQGDEPAAAETSSAPLPEPSATPAPRLVHDRPDEAEVARSSSALAPEPDSALIVESRVTEALPAQPKPLRAQPTPVELAQPSNQPRGHSQQTLSTPAVVLPQPVVGAGDAPSVSSLSVAAMPPQHLVPTLGAAAVEGVACAAPEVEQELQALQSVVATFTEQMANLVFLAAPPEGGFLTSDVQQLGSGKGEGGAAVVPADLTEERRAMDGFFSRMVSTATAMLDQQDERLARTV